MELTESATPTPPTGTRIARESTVRSPASPPRTVVHVPPLDVDGVRTVEIATLGWGITLLALLPFLPTLQAAERDWWIWVCSAGLGLGLLGIDVLRRRREARLTTNDGTIAALAQGRRRAR